MKKTALVLASIGGLTLSAVAAPTPAEARWRGGWAPGIAAGLIGAAVIGGLASSAYAYGPGYGYGGYPAYYGGYAPAYYDGYGYGGYGYNPYRWGGYTTTYYAPSYAPAYYGYPYRRAIRPAYAYYYGVPFPRRHFHHHRWHGYR